VYLRLLQEVQMVFNQKSPASENEMFITRKYGNLAKKIRKVKCVFRFPNLTWF
jgi:hypothetical protein